MAYKITGSVLAISQPQTLVSPKTGNSYTKRDLIITVRLFDPYTGQPTEDKTNTPKFVFMGDRCRDLDQFKIGDIVTVSFDIYGRSYEKEGRTEYLTDVRPFRVELNRQQPMAVQPQQPMMTQPQQPIAQTYPTQSEYIAQPIAQPYQQPPTQPYAPTGAPAPIQAPQQPQGDLPF